MKKILLFCIVGFASTIIVSGQDKEIKLLEISDKTTVESLMKPETTGTDQTLVDCLTCPSYDYYITAFTTFQTHNSSIVSNGCKIYLLTVSAWSTYTFKTGCGDGATADFDTYLELYNSSCNYITGNDDGCESNRSIITWFADYDGYVYLKVRGYNSSYYGSYTMAYKSDPYCVSCPSYTYYITPSSAFQTHSSTISSFGCRSYYLGVTSGYQYTFKTGCGDGASADYDTYLALTDGSCITLATDDDGCESNRSIINWTATYTGSVFLKVSGYGANFGSYTLAYRAYNPDLCKTCPSYDFTISPTSSFQTHSSSILSDGCKIYAVSVTSGRQCTFKTGCGDGASAGFDSFLELYNSGCSLVASDDDACESNRSKITWTATYSGTVYLKVRGYNNGSFGSYTLAYNEVQLPNYWIGTYSYQWENPVNWNLGHVPTATEEVIITPSGYQPCIIGVTNQQCKSLEIQAGANIAVDNKELQVNGNISINGFLSMYNASVIKLKGNWTRNPSTGTFTPGTGKVVFNQTEELLPQLCSTEHFYFLELNNVWSLQILNGAQITCNYYDWTAGVMYLENSGMFSAYDLVDNGIFGSYSLYNSSVVNFSNYDGYVDINGGLFIQGNSIMRIYGGTTYSYWPYTNDADIEIGAGSVLDFIDQGIHIYDTQSYNLVFQNSGTVRTSRGFSGNRADFHPTAGTFEFYGTSDYYISQSNGCTLHDVLINKGAKDNEKTYPTGPLTDERSGMIISDGGKSNTITLGSDFTITGDLFIDWGSAFDLGGYNCDVTNAVDVTGTLAINNLTDLTAYSINWKDGSQANITNGTIHVSNWAFEGGSSANIGIGNTAYVDVVIFVDYSSSYFGNLVLGGITNKSVNKSKAPTVEINGNLTILSGANWMFWTSVNVQGNFYSQNNSSITFENKTLSVGANTDLAGSVIFNDAGNLSIEGDLDLSSTGKIEINDGYVTCLHYGSANLDGSLVMIPNSIVSFPERDVTIGPNFNDNGIAGGTFQFGASLFAPTPGTFQINAANTQFISTSSASDEIGLGNNNWLYNVTIQRSYYIELTDNLTIKGNLDITDNKLQVSGKILTVEGIINIPHGILSLLPGSQLNIGNSMMVGTYGMFETFGTTGNANMVYGGTFGQYAFEVNSGGVIRGEYTIFKDMDDHGIYVKSGGIIDPASPLNYCTFQNGEAGGGLLTIENNQNLTIQNPSFPVITAGGGHNIIKNSNAGTIEMNSATGAMAGPAFEYDPYNLVNWTGGMPGLWTGNISSDWFNFSNWSDFSVPFSNVAVLIPDGCPNDPVVNGAQAYCYNLTIDPGADFTIGNNKLQVSNDIHIYGNLTMINPAGTLQGENIYWYAGSTDNVTAGEIRVDYWEFQENTLAKMGGSHTAYCAWLSCQDFFAEFANLHITPYSKISEIGAPKLTYYPLRVIGNMVMEPGSFFTPGFDLIINGNLEIQNGAMLGDYSGPELDLTCHGNLNIAGIMRLYYSSEVLVHGNLSFTGYLTIYPDCEFTCDYNSASGWTTLNGNLDLYPGSDFNFTGANVLIGPSFNLIEYAPYPPYFNAGMTFGRSLSAPSANFLVDHIYTSFSGNNTGHYIDLNAANYLLSLVINKPSGGDLYLQSNLIVKDIVSIGFESTLRAYDKSLYAGGDWYENYFSSSGGFEPMTGRVIFNGNADQTIYGQADYNTLEINKAGGQFVVPSGSTSICNSYDYTAGGIRVNGGTFTALDMYNDFFNGNNQITNGALSLHQDALQNLNLLGILDISGGEMNVTCTSGDFSWGFYDDCHIAMSNGEIIVNAPEGLSIAVDQYGIFSENITGGTIKVYNELDVVNPSFTPTGGTIELLGPDITMAGMIPASNVFNLLINKSGTDKSGFSETYQNDKVNSDGGKANEVRLYSDLTVNGTLTVAKGLLDLNGYDVKVSQSAMINNGGTMEVDAGASLLMASGQTLAVTEGGVLNVLGTSGNEAKVSRITSGNYTFNIDAGGTIGAQYGIFEYMSTNGIYIKSGSFVNPSYSFNNCTFRNGISGGRLMTISNTESFTATGAIFPTNTWGGSYNVYKNVASGTVNFVGATGGFAGAAYEYDPNNLVNWTAETRTLVLKAYLEGPFNGTNMNTTVNGILPLSHPFNPALPYFGNPLPDWRYTGSGSVGAIPNVNIVDWILVELRDAVSAANATKATMVAQFPAFILNNGSIVSLDGASNLQFSNPVANNLFVVIYNRNHQSIMNANIIPYASGTYTYDFTTGAAQVFGGVAGHKQLATGKWGMRSGDGNGDCDVTILDKTNVWNISGQNGKTGYLPSDFNHDRQTNNKDKNDKWFPNNNTYSQVPN